MIAGVADTHTALWYLFENPKLSRAAGDFIDRAAAVRQKIAISAISVAEIVYLVEKNRIPADAYEAITAAMADPEHVFMEAACTNAVIAAMREVSRSEIADMPDRIVAATAAYFRVPVISRDGRIRTASIETIW
jgi:PIN domain nuclease of toxin-antitoxin system